MRLGTSNPVQVEFPCWKRSTKRQPRSAESFAPFVRRIARRQKKPGASLLPAGEVSIRRRPRPAMPRGTPQRAFPTGLLVFEHHDPRAFAGLDVQEHAFVDRGVFDLRLEVSHALDVLAADLRDHVAAVEARLVSRAP